MSIENVGPHPLAKFRAAAGLSQAELAGQAGVPRSTVSAIESRRLTPSVSAALALAKALGRSVESVFGEGPRPAEWAIEPSADRICYSLAAIGERVLAYPASAAGGFTHDGVWTPGGDLTGSPAADFMPGDTLVIACCDPASAMLALRLARSEGIRLLVLERGGLAALELLRRGLVHAAGLHFSNPAAPDRNAEIVHRELGTGHHLLRVAAWEEGIALPASESRSSVAALRRRATTWALREPGSAARECFDACIGGPKSAAGRIVPGHAAVAASIRDGWAGGGVCVRYSAEEAGVAFRPLRREFLDFCFDPSMPN